MNHYLIFILIFLSAFSGISLIGALSAIKEDEFNDLIKWTLVLGACVIGIIFNYLLLTAKG